LNRRILQAEGPLAFVERGNQGDATSQMTARLKRKQILAGAVGNTLEWYDFAIYGFLAPIIGKVFFPSEDHLASLLAAYGALAVGYASRPIGSVIFGHIGDRYGRKPALMLSVAVMGCATLAIGLLPGHAEIGVAASVLLIVLRTVQGLSVAGEYASSATLLVEQAPAERRGLVASWVVMGCNLGFLMGSAVAALVSNLIGDAAMLAWGWRIPFFLGAAIAVYALLLRRNMSESPVIGSDAILPRMPVLEVLKDHWRTILRIICLILPTGVTYFLVFVYAVSYLTDQMHFSTAKALDITTLALVVLVAVTPVVGLLADRYGRRPVMFFVSIASLCLTWPLWFALHQPALAWILFAQLSFALINGIGWAMTVPLMVELLPARVRCSGAGISYNICLGFFGGTTPWVATYLIARTSDDYAPVYYVMAIALIALIATWKMPEMKGKSLQS
jgi:MHS family proline/betaine transporter-like MFS transporter